jgi:hypothetical protein
VSGLQALPALVDDLFGDRTGLHQGQAAVELAFGELDFGTRVGQLTVGLFGNRLEGTGVDQIEQVAGMDDVAVLEFDIVTKPPTRGRTCTSSTASNRPVNSSQSVTVRLTGCATVTAGAGVAAAAWDDFCSQPASASANSIPIVATPRR